MEQSNVIQGVFNYEFKVSVYAYLKAAGLQATKDYLLDLGYQPVFINALLRHIMRTRGW